MNIHPREIRGMDAVKSSPLTLGELEFLTGLFLTEFLYAPPFCGSRVKSPSGLSTERFSASTSHITRDNAKRIASA